MFEVAPVPGHEAQILKEFTDLTLKCADGLEAMLDILAEIPRALFGPFGDLQVAPRHVETTGVTVDRRHGLVALRLENRLSERQHQFHFVVKILRPRRIGDR
mgnify:CR=1 FL=1